jgi:hypothetical protein
MKRTTKRLCGFDSAGKTGQIELAFIYSVIFTMAVGAGRIKAIGLPHPGDRVFLR